MLKLAKINFALGVFMLLCSCKTVELSQKGGGSDYEIVIKLQDVGIYGDLMSSAGKIISPADIQMTGGDNNFLFEITELRMRYDAVTDDTIQMIRRELHRCRGILELNISRL